MKITYIHHSGFLVELEHTRLLFDYVGGPLPEPDQNKLLAVFSSHRHGDHFDPMIFRLADQNPKTCFILSDDIWKKRVPEKNLGKTVFMKAGEQWGPAEGRDLQVRTYKSTDEGVAFAVKCEGRTIYHAGDLNDWHWEGEPDSWNNNMHANYMRELEKMKTDGLHPDAAMIPVDGRLEQWFYQGLHEFMEEVGADIIFPMHFWNDFGIIDRLKQLPCAKGYKDLIAPIKGDGQTFVYER